MTVAPEDIYDSDILAFEKVEQALNAYRKGRPVNREGLRQKIIDDYAKIGWEVDVVVKGDIADREYVELTPVLVARIDKHEFDHERQAHEVQNAILEIDQPGTITADGKLVDPKRTF